MASKRIFIVDDDADMVQLMTALLEAAGHEVASNTVGLYAIHEIVDRRPDCVLIDLMMAEPDGFELARELTRRRELQDTAFVMVSARSDAMWAERAREAGLAGYITKPIDVDTFADQVVRFLG